jgi:hypothetical protein
MKDLCVTIFGTSFNSVSYERDSLSPTISPPVTRQVNNQSWIIQHRQSQFAARSDHEPLPATSRPYNLSVSSVVMLFSDTARPRGITHRTTHTKNLKLILWLGLPTERWETGGETQSGKKE